MHRVLEIATESAARQGATQIHRIGLRIGVLSGVVPDALMFAFEALRDETPAKEAVLEVEYLPLRLFCPACDREFAVEELEYACPECGTLQTDIRQGREMDITFIEVSAEETRT